VKPPYNTGILPLAASGIPALTSNRHSSLPVAVGIQIAQMRDVFGKC